MPKFRLNKHKKVDLEGPPAKDLPWYVVGLQTVAMIALIVLVIILVWKTI